jgi:hypothetical protein
VGEQARQVQRRGRLDLLQVVQLLGDLLQLVEGAIIDGR